MAVESRLLKVEDLAVLLEIEALSNPSPWSERMFHQEMENELSHFFVFFLANAIIGFGGYQDMVRHGHISSIAVHPQYRRKGLGRDIVRFLLSDMEEQSIETATLEVRASNLPAAALYEQCGFTLEGRRKAYYRNGEDALIYSRRLSEAGC